MKYLFCSAVAITVLSTPSWAADAPYDWTGAYIGLQAGHGWGDSVTSIFLDTVDEPSVPDGPADIEGFIGGLHAGWNWEFDNLVFGLEADANLANIDGSFTFEDELELTTDIQAAGSLRGRIGFAVDRALIYGTGGLAVADVELGVVTVGELMREEKSQSYFGYTVGAGVEFVFTDDLSTRIEYRYTDLGNENFNWATVFSGYNADYDIDFHSVQAGLSWHF
jgi:outer membrane immunogenic protein